MKHASLFSGIGGFDLAAEWAGWENKFHCEWNEFGQKVLNYYWPKAICYGDITKTDFTIWRGRIDVLTGGFPCQPYSLAGKRLGKEDERHLWPEMLRAIREIQPKWVVGENVLGITNWNGGLVFNEVQSDLEAEGYEVQSYVLPAAGINAPHKRERVWFVAHSKITTRLQTSKAINEREKHFIDSRNGIRNTPVANGGCRVTTDTESTRKQRQCQCEQRKVQSDRRNCRSIPADWQNFPTQPPVCGGNDGLPRELDGITFSKWRNESIKAYGNAIVPGVVYQIFKAINEYENAGN